MPTAVSAVLNNGTGETVSFKFIFQTRINMAKLSSSEYKMLLESIDFIRQNQNISNKDIPDSFIQAWSVKDLYNPQCKANEVQILLFMYILKLHFQSTEKLEEILNSYHFYQLFYDFQLILAATSYCRLTKTPLNPFPIFDISQYKSPNLKNTEELLEQFQNITRMSIKQ